MSTPTKQRLAIFLDGTWNTEDDSTNVLNAYHYTREGLITKEEVGGKEEVIQKRYYDRGVGTGVLDSLTGGGFGLGLEVNVREAYNWLVDNYNDNDEIYIFGFSRGAYTARSLVGLIGACGLVRRGAPLTVSQLWNGYAFISQHRDEKKREWWVNALKENKYNFRRITDLKFARGDSKSPINKSEELIIKWSRRVDITFLGIYDTVGAMGIQALGIPGLRSKLAENHNLNPTTIIKNCRHTLAIDEHRSSFRLTPILHWVSNYADGEETERYKDIIKQRWFVGAHSNIGGGYANNTLSMRPLQWMLEGAKNAGLRLADAATATTSSDEEHAESSGRTDIRDSFAELAGAVWPHFLREKRNPRPIGRADLVHADYSLRTINEEIDESVFTLAKHNKEYAPPNLLAYLRQFPEKDKDEIFKGRQPRQSWPGEILVYGKERNWLNEWLMPRIYLIFWSTLVAIGLVEILSLFWLEPLPINWLFYSIIATLYVLIDWGEYRLTLKTAFFPEAVIPKVAWNVLYWLRLFGVLAFFAGLFYFFRKAIILGWDAEFTIAGIFDFLKNLLDKIFQSKYYLPFLASAVIMFVLDYFGKFSLPENKEKQSRDGGAIDLSEKVKEVKEHKIIIKLAVALSLLLFIPSLLACWHYQAASFSTLEVGTLSGKLLLIYILLVVFWAMTAWVGKPMDPSKANLGSIVQLQNCYTNTQVSLLFNHWAKKLSRRWVEPAHRKELAWTRVREVIRAALWRDFLGFIPIYSLILGTILFIGSELDFCFIAGINCNATLFAETPFWLVLIIITALADITENIIHLQHLKNHPHGGSSRSLVAFGTIATLIKFLGFFAAALMSLAIIVFLIKIMLTNVGGWRWIMAAGISYVLIFAVVSFGIRSIWQYLKGKKPISPIL